MNKQILTTIVLILGLFIVISFKSSPGPVLDAHRVGDVVYSILDSTHFIQEHGTGWVVMRGQALNPATSRLAHDYGVGSAPDARGVFLRGMNLGRDVNTGDADGDRGAVGAPQADQVGPHNHRISVAVLNWESGGSYGLDYIASRLPNVNAPSTDGLKTRETRPRNIALYIYLKVD